MKTFHKFLIGLAAAGLLVSCDKDYLNTAPTESVGSAEALADYNNAIATLNGIAKTMSIQYSYYGQGFAGENAIWTMYENYPSQHFNYNGYASGWSVIFNQSWHTNPNTVYNHYAWFYYYSIISEANTIIHGLDETDAKEEQKQYLKASALVYRAYAYQKLLNYYAVRWVDSDNGTADGVVLRIEDSTEDQPIVSQVKVYQQIYDDCDEAISLFAQSGLDRGDGEVWLPNANVAHAVKARAALTRADYPTAASEARLARDGYPLVSGTAYNDGFCKPNSEWIFGSFGDSTEQLWYYAFGVQFACNGYYAANTSYGAGAIDLELANRIPNGDARKALFLTPDKFSSYDPSNSVNLQTSLCLLGVTNNSGRPVVTNAALVKEIEAYISDVSVDNGVYDAGFYYLGAQLKFYVDDMPGVSCLPFIRSSEMVLIEAEANYFDNNTEAAQASLVELNAKTGRTPGYTCTKTGEDLLAEIRDYRAIELWGEGQGWSDYKRWKLPISRKSFTNGGNANVAVAVTIAPDAANNWTWVIPKRETDYNKALGGGETPEE